MTQETSPARVTIVITQRDRVSAMPDSLTSLFDNTAGKFDLVVVSGRLRPRMRTWLNHLAQTASFTHVEAGRPLTPAEARNIGIRHAKTDYIVFAENDIVYQRGWLNALIACADETGADMVAPLTCEGRPLHTIIHHVGTVESNQDTFSNSAANERDFDEDFFLQGRTLAEVEHLLVRRKTQSVEMHCFMVRRDLFDRIGHFDPDIVSKEYLDFSWRVTRNGGSIWLEPKSVVTFLVPSKADPVALADLPYFLLRWSRSWQKRSHDALKTKWGLTEDGFIASRRALADWRIVDHVTKPALERVPVLGRRWGFVTRAAGVVNAALLAASNWLAWGYDRARRAERPKAAAHATH